MLRLLYLACFSLLSISLPACFQARGETPVTNEQFRPIPKADPIPVKVQRAERRSFSLHTLTTGTLVAARQAKIAFRRGGSLKTLPIREGRLVTAGSILAEVDNTDLQLQLEQSKISLAEAMVDKKDLLIANGGDAESDTSVSADKLDLILTLSGVKRAQHKIKQTEYELTQTKVLAPFDGLVADLQVQQYEQVNPGQSICTLIDPQSFEISFSVLEEEALQLQLGQGIRVAPVARPDQKLRAHISIINPQVNDQGLVQVYATLKGKDNNRLLEGMNVQVWIEKRIPNQLLAPKSALVLRSGREVIFTYDEKEQLAKWHYVETTYQNDEYVAIASGLDAGSLVIYEGHFNLDQDVAVVIDD